MARSRVGCLAVVATDSVARPCVVGGRAVDGTGDRNRPFTSEPGWLPLVAGALVSDRGQRIAPLVARLERCLLTSSRRSEGGGRTLLARTLARFECRLIGRSGGNQSRGRTCRRQHGRHRSVFCGWRSPNCQVGTRLVLAGSTWLQYQDALENNRCKQHNPYDGPSPMSPPFRPSHVLRQMSPPFRQGRRRPHPKQAPYLCRRKNQ
jgi:hypothetical protein